jgi:Tfp pilus assembly protein PilN
MNTTNKTKQTASARLASWLGALYEVGWCLRRDLPARVEERERRIKVLQAEINMHRAEIRKIEKDAERQAREFWSEEQIAAAKQGETMTNDGRRWSAKPTA